MAISDAKRRANYKYDRKAYRYLTVKVKTADADKLKILLEADGLTVNAFLARYIAAYLEQAGTD